MSAQVIWWDARHREGQIRLANGEKCYFNYSVLQDREYQFKRDEKVTFEIDADELPINIRPL